MNRTPGFELEKKAAGDEAKTPEQLAEEKAAADKAAADKATADKAAADKAAADGKKTEEEGKVEPDPLDKLGPLPVETLAKAITDNPTLAAELEKAGIDSELLYETSRRAARTDQYEQIYPTVEAAQFADESAKHFYDIEDGFPKIQTVEDLDGFITKTMLPLSVLKDPATGEPLKNPDGSYQTDGSIARFFDSTSQMETVMSVRAVDRLLANVPAGDEGEEAREQLGRIKDAIILAQEFRDNGYRVPGKKGAGQPQRSAEDQKAIDDANKIKQDAAKQSEEARQATIKAYDDGVMNDIGTAVTGFVSGVLNRTALSDFDKEKIADSTMSKAWESLDNNRHWKARKDHLQSLPATPENHKLLVAHAKVGFELAAKTILEAEIKAAGGKVMSASAAKRQKQETQQTNDRMNQGSGTTPSAKAPQPASAADVRAQAIKNLKAAGNQYPSDGDIISEAVRIRAATRTA